MSATTAKTGPDAYLYGGGSSESPKRFAARVVTRAAGPYPSRCYCFVFFLPFVVALNKRYFLVAG